MADEEGYPDGWWHATVHLNPATGEIHCDGDYRVRVWLMERLPAGGDWRAAQEEGE